MKSYLKPAPWPHRRLVLVIDDPLRGDERWNGTPIAAVQEYLGTDEWLACEPWIASNGLRVHVYNGTSYGEDLTFGQALEALRDGLKVRRDGWNGKGLWLELQVPDAHSKMTLPYIFMSYPNDAQNTPGARVPWLASQTDMLATDWAVVD